MTQPLFRITKEAAPAIKRARSVGDILTNRVIEMYDGYLPEELTETELRRVRGIGPKRAERIIATLTQDIPEEIAQAAAGIVLERLTENAPYRTGALARSLGVEVVERATGHIVLAITSDVPQARYTLFGTGLYATGKKAEEVGVIRPRQARALVWPSDRPGSSKKEQEEGIVIRAWAAGQRRQNWVRWGLLAAQGELKGLMARIGREFEVRPVARF